MQEHLISGALAGLAVDLALYPLDTLKTRIQAANGFLASGGFARIYSGLSPVLLGSVPSAALFFSTYEAVRKHTNSILMASVAGETVACLVRVPVEVYKQNRQVHQTLSICRQKGLWALSATWLRDVSFSATQFVLWETAKPYCGPWIGGALAGGLAALITTPVDYWKTQIILSPNLDKKLLLSSSFKGAIPRTLNFSLGGFLFLGLYDFLLQHYPI